MIRRKKERKHFFCLSLSLSPLLTTSFPLPDPSFRLFLLPLGEGFKKITMSRLAILCSLVLAALAGVAHSQSADWGSPAANSTAQALANAVARAAESAAVKIVATETAVNNLQKGLNATAIAAAGASVSLEFLDFVSISRTPQFCSLAILALVRLASPPESSSLPLMGSISRCKRARDPGRGPRTP
jgi:hypothetical protein